MGEWRRIFDLSLGPHDFFGGALLWDGTIGRVGAMWAEVGENISTTSVSAHFFEGGEAEPSEGCSYLPRVALEKG